MREILFRGQTRRNGEKVWINGEKVPSNWVYGGICFGKGAFSIIYDYMDEEKEKPIEKHVVYTETVGQYTGLTDKNGKKIFEGDIVKCRHNWRLQVYPNGQIPDVEKYFFEQKIRNAYGKYKVENPNWMGDDYYYFRNYVIEYYAPNGCFRVRNGGQFHNLTGSYIFNRYLEVIGNIHDNPELLKGE
jgi:uncharacterized phage protein (TIGR01671 family)